MSNNRIVAEPILINASNAHEYPWLLDFFHASRSDNTYQWLSGRTYQHQQQTFQFTSTILARSKKKDPARFVYEMINDNDLLGSGSFGSVYGIHCTIGANQQGHYRVRDKRRIVKVSRWIRATRYESEISQFAPYLHSKMHIGGYLVMKRMPGERVQSYVTNNSLTRAQKWRLTVAIAKAIKAQLADNHLIHRDLHTRNMLVHIDPHTGQYVVNILDLGHAQHNLHFNADKVSNDLYDAMAYNHRQMWGSEIHVPAAMQAVFTQQSLNDILLHIDYSVLAAQPEIQWQLDQYSQWLVTIAKMDKALADELMKLLKLANGDVHQLREMIVSIKQKMTAYKGAPAFPCILIADNPDTQKTLDKISAFYTQLSEKFATIKEGASHLSKVNALRNLTFEACYSTPEQRNMKYHLCHKTCMAFIKDNQNAINTHRNSRYIFAEIGIILACLVIFYPLAAGIHYAATGRFRFFSETRVSAATKQWENDVKSLTNSGLQQNNR